SLGLLGRVASGVFAICLLYLALADRLSAFTVSKLGAVIAIALFFTPCGSRYGIDAWIRRRRHPNQPQPTLVAAGNVRFFQILLVTLYCGSGICKLRGDWLTHSNVLWTHLHDSYQTGFTYLLARSIPAWGWAALQW